MAIIQSLLTSDNSLNAHKKFGIIFEQTELPKNSLPGNSSWMMKGIKNRPLRADNHSSTEAWERVQY